MLSNGDDAEIAFDDEDLENFPLDKDDLAPERALEDCMLEFIVAEVIFVQVWSFMQVIFM